jgi:rfaE bifunctional protein kinase chain/domain/rfaE bifunctional protein nucleotidyltransferase chain/domain
LIDENPKIKTLDALAEHLAVLKSQGKKIVHSHGVFDLLHVGHIRHFEEARKMGDVLVVTLTRDDHVNKGPHRPAFPHDVRAQVIAALGAVDYVAVNRWPLSVETIKLLKPDIYVKGPDYKNSGDDVTGGIVSEADTVRSVGGKICFTDDVTFSSSNLLNRYFSSFPAAVEQFLKQFREKYSMQAVREYVESFQRLKVLVLGEAIVDEYVYCDPLGKSAKEPIIAMRYLTKEAYAGGALAIANHVAEFCDQVELLTYVGSQNSQESFIKKNLSSNVRLTTITKANSPTIVKRRYVEKYLVTKLLEIYEMNDAPLSDEEDAALCSALEQKLDEVDVVIVADFGHGLISPRVVQLLSAKAKCLAVNTQMNAANIGYHAISKYARADYVCIHEGEVRLDQRDKTGDLEPLVADLSRRLGCRTVMVTRGKRGTLLYREGEGLSECPALASQIVDRVGAGDAVLAVTALCAADDLPLEMIGFLGNVVGAQAVATVGNSSSVDRVGTLKTVQSLLK